MFSPLDAAARWARPEQSRRGYAGGALRARPPKSTARRRDLWPLDRRGRAVGRWN